MFRIEARRDIKAAITATAVDPSSAYAMGPVWAGRSITSAGSVVASATPGGGQTTQIYDVRTGIVTTSGCTLAGPITCLNGSIGDIIAAGSIAISSGGIQARDGIDYIEAVDIDADIRANANSGSGDLGGLLVTSGDLAGSLRCQDLTTGNFSSDGLLCYGEVLASLEFDGSLLVPIVAAGFGGTSEVIIHGDLLAYIAASDGSIHSIEIDGDMRAFVQADENIDSIHVSGSIIADYDSQLIRIQATNGTLGELIVDGDILDYNLIDPPQGSFIAALEIGNIEAHHVEWIIRGSGDYDYVHLDHFHATGSASAYAGEGASHGWRIYDFEDFRVDGGATGLFRFRTIPLGTVAQFEGELAGNVYIDHATGLDGQIALNCGDDSVGWVASVHVRAANNTDYITLSTATSSTPSADLGGGSVGLVRFNLHNYDCRPINGDTTCMEAHTETWATQPYERETIVLSHRGKVFDSLPSTGPIPVVVMRQSLSCPYGDPCPGGATNVSSSCTVATGMGTNGREVWICMTPANSSTPVSFGSPYRFTITPLVDGGTTDLRSDQTGLGTAPNVYSYTYVIDTLCD